MHVEIISKNENKMTEKSAQTKFERNGLSNKEGGPQLCQAMLTKLPQNELALPVHNTDSKKHVRS
jgi:hypothetical protein